MLQESVKNGRSSLFNFITAVSIFFIALGCDSSLQENKGDGPLAAVDGGVAEIEIFNGRDNRQIPYICVEHTDCNDDDVCTRGECVKGKCEYKLKKIRFSPVRIETAAPAVDVSLSDGRLFVAEGEGGVEVFSLADLAQPIFEATIPTLSDAFDVEAVSGTLIVAEGTEGVEFFSVPGYQQQRQVAADTDFLHGIDDVRSIDGGSRYGFVSGYADGVILLNFANPASPSPLDDLSTQGRAMRTASSYTAAVVADALGGAAIIGFDTPDGVVVTKQIATQGRVTDADLVLDTAIIAEYGGGFGLLDLSDPTLPVRLVGYPSASPVTTAALIGSQTAVVGDEAGLLRLFDVTIHHTGKEETDDLGTARPVATAAEPTVIDTWSADDVPVRMDALDGVLAVALSAGGVALFNTGCQE